MSVIFRADCRSSRRATSPPLERRALRSARALLLVGALGLLAGACSDDQAADDDSRRPARVIPPTTVAATTPPTTADAVAAPCVEAELSSAATSEYAGSTLLDISCATGFAIATIEGGATPGGGAVAFFVSSDGAWSVAGIASPDSDLTAALPPDAPKGLVFTWRDARDRRLNPPTTTTETTLPPESNGNV